jgi:hypothetical protein
MTQAVDNINQASEALNFSPSIFDKAMTLARAQVSAQKAQVSAQEALDKELSAILQGLLYSAVIKVHEANVIEVIATLRGLRAAAWNGEVI